MTILRRLLRQFDFWRSSDRPASRLRKLRLALTYDCRVSSRADIYYIDRIQLGRNVQINERVILNYRSGGGREPNVYPLPDRALVTARRCPTCTERDGKCSAHIGGQTQLQFVRPSRSGKLLISLKRSCPSG